MHQDLINKLKSSAYRYFGDFGFASQEIDSLIETGKRDLEKELHKLKPLLDHTPVDTAQLDDRLHGIKGIFAQLGSHDLAAEINELRNDLHRQESIDRLKRILYGEC